MGILEKERDDFTGRDVAMLCGSGVGLVLTVLRENRLLLEEGLICKLFEPATPCKLSVWI